MVILFVLIVSNIKALVSRGAGDDQYAAKLQNERESPPPKKIKTRRTTQANDPTVNWLSSCSFISSSVSKPSYNSAIPVRSLRMIVWLVELRAIE